MEWIVNSTDGLSYSMPMVEECIPQVRNIVTGFVGMCSWFDGITQSEVPNECPDIRSGGCGLISIGDEW